MFLFHFIIQLPGPSTLMSSAAMAGDEHREAPARARIAAADLNIVSRAKSERGSKVPRLQYVSGGKRTSFILDSRGA